MTDPGQVEAAVRAATDAFGRVDVLVNNAGQGLHAPIDEIDPDDFRVVLELNLVAPLVTSSRFEPAASRRRVWSPATRRGLKHQSRSPVILDLIRTGAERADLPERFGGSYQG